MTYEEAKRYLLAKAKDLNVAIEIITSETRELTLEAFEKALSQMTQAEKGGLGLRVIVEGKTGYASTEERSQEALDWVLTEATENARLQSAVDGFLPEKQELGHTDLLGEGLSAPVHQKAQAALDFENALRQDSRLKQVGNARYTEREVTFSLASSKGTKGGYRKGLAGFYSSVIAQKGESLKQGYDLTFEHDFHALNPGKTALEHLERTARHLGAKPLKTGRYRSYFEPKAFNQLLSLFSYMVNGKTLVEGKSPLAHQLGQKIASDIVTFIDDPGLEDGLANQPFDSEGTPSQKVVLVEKGVFKNFLHNTATGKKAGQTSTGHASRSYRSTLDVDSTNLYLAPGEGVSGDDGVIITDLRGLHAGANPITGEFSLQGLGLRLEKGEHYPAEDFAVSGNLLTVFKTIVGLGQDLEWSFSWGVAGSPMVEVEDLSFAGA